jgi:hypothetical protein
MILAGIVILASALLFGVACARLGYVAAGTRPLRLVVPCLTIGISASILSTEIGYFAGASRSLGRLDMADQAARAIRVCLGDEKKI